MTDEAKAPFLKHLAELRTVILHCFIAVAALFFPFYAFLRFDLLRLVTEPVVSALPPGQTLIFTKPSEGFAALVAVSLFFAFMSAMPFILYKIRKFIAPGLRETEKKWLSFFVFFGTVSFVTGVFFCHSQVAPRAMDFLLGENSSDFVRAMPSLGQSLSFLLTMCLAFGIVFEFPLVAFTLSRLGIVNAKTLGGARKYSYLAGSVLAAVITPTTDLASMMFLLIPIFVFYEAGIIIAKFFGKTER